MQIQMSGDSPHNERIFRVARNSYTKTATITAASLSRGAPAVLATESASINGYDVKNGDTKGVARNNLLLGVVHDYPQGTTADVWNPEDVGVVQVYGLADVFMNITTKTDTLDGGTMLVPNTGSAFATSLPPVYVTGTVASSILITGLSGVAGLVVLAQTLASQASETFTAKAFVRCL